MNQMLKSSEGQPKKVTRAEATPWLWGDDRASFASDLFYCLTEQLGVVVASMPPGGSYTASDEFKANYDSDECLYVLSGQYTILNPETGEVRVANAGETVFLRGPQWHYGCNFSDQELKILEAVAPMDASPKHALTIPSPPLYRDIASLADFPRSRDAGHHNMDIIRRGEGHHLLLGEENRVLCEVLGNNERVSMSAIELRAGQRSDPLQWPREACLFVERGTVHIRVPKNGLWLEVAQDETFHAPAGTAWQLFNHSGARARTILSIGGSILG